MAAHISYRMGCYWWTQWRSSAYSVGNIVGNREVPIPGLRKDQGVTLFLDLVKAIERVSLLVVWAWATHFSFPRKILRVLCWYFEHQMRVQFEGCAAEPLTTIMAILPGSKWSCSLLSIVLQDALSEVTKNYPPLKLRVFVDGITALLSRWEGTRIWWRRRKKC